MDSCRTWTVIQMKNSPTITVKSNLSPTIRLLEHLALSLAKQLIWPRERYQKLQSSIRKQPPIKRLGRRKASHSNHLWEIPFLLKLDRRQPLLPRQAIVLLEVYSEVLCNQSPHSVGHLRKNLQRKREREFNVKPWPNKSRTTTRPWPKGPKRILTKKSKSRWLTPKRLSSSYNWAKPRGKMKLLRKVSGVQLLNCN